MAEYVPEAIDLLTGELQKIRVLAHAISDHCQDDEAAGILSDYILEAVDRANVHAEALHQKTRGRHAQPPTRPVG